MSLGLVGMQQQLAQVEAEDADGLLFGVLREEIADFPLQGREKQTLIAVGNGQGQPLRGAIGRGNDSSAQSGDKLFVRRY